MQDVFLNKIHLTEEIPLLIFVLQPNNKKTERDLILLREMKAMKYPKCDHDSHRFCEILKNILGCFLVLAVVFTSVNLSPQTLADAA